MAPVPNSLSDVAPTLAELKKLPLKQKARLLLGRLAKIGQHNESALNKHNLMLSGDPYALAHGYPDGEKLAVREHLFGAPWMKLVNEGYMVDLSGQGFFKVSDEGREFLNLVTTLVAPTPATPSPGAAGAHRCIRPSGAVAGNMQSAGSTLIQQSLMGFAELNDAIDEITHPLQNNIDLLDTRQVAQEI
jgi:hypothetical protein